MCATRARVCVTALIIMYHATVGQQEEKKAGKKAKAEEPVEEVELNDEL